LLAKLCRQATTCSLASNIRTIASLLDIPGFAGGGIKISFSRKSRTNRPEDQRSCDAHDDGV